MSSSMDTEPPPTPEEAAFLSRARLGAVLPRGEAEQLLASRLLRRGWLNVGSGRVRGGRRVRDNVVWTSFPGAYVLAGVSGPGTAGKKTEHG